MRALIKRQKEWNKKQHFWIKVMAVFAIAVLCFNIYSVCHFDKNAAQVAHTLTNIDTYTPTIASMHEKKDAVATSVTSYW